MLIPKSKNSASLGSRLVIAGAGLAAILGGLTGCAQTNETLAAARPVAITHDTFALADANHDGKLSRQEAAKYLVYVVFTASDTDADGRLTEREWIHDDPAQATAFHERDADGDGVVTLAEAVAYSERGPAALGLMRQADRNRDGKLNRAEVDAYFMRVIGTSS